MKVVDLMVTKELMDTWTELRQQILNGRVKSLAVCTKGVDGKETVLVAGDYRTDAVARLGAAMKISWEVTKETELEDAAIKHRDFRNTA